MKINVTVWNEFRHEREHEDVRAVYPDGIHNAVASFLKAEEGVEVRTATLDEPEHGLTDDALDWTDVLVWWGHMAHHEVSDAVVNKVFRRVTEEGMGLVVLHSGHASKIFQKLCGTPSNLLSWRESGDLERVWVVNPAHPIAAGIDDYFEVPHTETYAEYFNIPQPDELIFISWYSGGEVFRSGFTLTRGLGKVFYFSPGHESMPIYHQKEVQRIISNGVKYVRRPRNMAGVTYRNNTDLNGNPWEVGQ
jgi:trehalose utilization protein